MPVQLPSRAKLEQLSDEEIIALAKKWVALHADQKTRDKMDDLLKNMAEPTQRKVILLGQRISAGLPIKIAADL
jgi:hypothetical protein